ncbi:MAG: hypothetical protein IKY83_07825 [Proteobacteria bacterium]|nr:hypothetical protein [Pseudomonadota bacterium]
MLKKSLIFITILGLLALPAAAQDVHYPVTAPAASDSQPDAAHASDIQPNSVPDNTAYTPTDALHALPETAVIPPERAAIPPALMDIQTSQRNTRQDNTACFESITYANALMRAENAYVRRKYETVIEILRPLYDTAHCIDDPDSILEINLLLGVAYFEQNNLTLADTFFMNILRSDPEHIVGSIITLPESSAHRIESLREQHAEELESLRKQSAPNTVIESLYVLAETEKHHYWINFLPFGAGEFQMHQNEWGAVYASTQLAGIALSILGGGMVEHYRGNNFMFTPDHYTKAKTWQKVQIAGVAILGASYVASVIHALFIHEDKTMILHSPTQTRPDIAHSAAPFILSDGAGIAYGAVF